MRSLGSKVRTWWKNDELRDEVIVDPKPKRKLLKKVQQQCTILQPSLTEECVAASNDLEYSMGLGSIQPTLSGKGVSVTLTVTEQQTERKIALIEEKEEQQKNFPFILTQDMIIQIAIKGFPTPINYFSKWKRIYSLSRDGDSFSTMLRHVQNENRTIVVIRSTKGDIFGGFVDSPWECKHDGFYGSAQAFLFKYQNNTISTYKWTGVNRYIQFCDSTSKAIAMGGGGGHFGLCVEDDFRRGSTGRCETFGNDPLMDEEQFNVLELEIWGFVSCALE